MGLSDIDLVTLAKAARDSAAFETLVRRHQAPLRAFLIRLTGDAPAADDLAQEALIKAYRGLPPRFQEMRLETIASAHVSKIPTLKYLRLEEVTKALGGL